MRATPFRLTLLVALLAALPAATTIAATALANRPAPTSPASSFLPFYQVREEIMTGTSPVAVSDPVSGRVYIGHGGEVRVIETQSSPGFDSVAVPFPPERLALNGDGSRLFLAQDPPDNELTGRIAVVNTATLAVIKTFTFTCPLGNPWVACHLSGMAAGPDNRLYLAYTRWPAIDIHDSTTGDRLLRYPHPGSDNPAALAVHGDALYTLQTPYQSPTSPLRRFDVSEITPALADEAAVPGTGSLQVAPDGSFLIVGGLEDRKALQIDAAALTVSHTYEAQGEYVYYKSVIPSANSDEVVLLYGYTPPEVRTVIEAHDAATGALIRVAEYQMGPDSPNYYYQNGILTLPGNEVAHLFPDRLQVLHPLSHVAGVPVVLSGFCAGPVYDDFSNPASGWPIANHGTVSYGYDLFREYHILHLEADSWTAVSRGDLWIDGEGAQVRTWLPAKEGISGLVFGLNDDWTHFYTFEVIPHLHAWAVLFYHNGWQVWGVEQSGAVNGVGQSNTLTLELGPVGDVYLKINGTTVFTMPGGIPDGRIGLSGGSYAPEVDVRFDDYLFVGRNCSPNRRAGTLDRSPSLERPPLEELLDRAN